MESPLQLFDYRIVSMSVCVCVFVIGLESQEFSLDAQFNSIWF